MSAASYEGAERDPFGLTAGVDDYVPSAAIERALAEALAALAEDRVPVISGPTGLGKTLLLHLLGRASEERCRPLYVPYCSLGPEELASLVLGLLDWQRADDPEMALLEAARRVGESGRRLLLLVDDAASLPGESAAQLAHWLNASGGALEIALAGLPGASLRHARDAFGDRAEEVSLASGLRTDEIRSYVETRLARAAAEPAIRAAFDDAALAELERVSAGNPRRVNLAAQAIVRNAYHAQTEPEEGSAEASEAARQVAASAGTGTTAAASSLAEVPTGVGEYRFVRGRFVDPQTGAAVATPGSDDGVWREPLGVREAPRRAPPAREADPDIDADLGVALGSEIGGEAPDALEGREDSSSVTRPEPWPPASRQRGSLRWMAAGIAAIAFAVGVWTEMREPAGAGSSGDVSPAPPAQRATPAPDEPLPQQPPAEATATAQGVPSAPTAPPPAPPSEPMPPAALPSEPMPPAALPSEPMRPAPDALPAATQAVSPPEPATQPATPPALPSAEPTSPELAQEELSESVPTARAQSPETGDAAPAAAEPAAPRAESVSIAINATPWAVIEIDGEEVGETPLAGIQLTTGRHRFLARMPDGTVRERVVHIDADTPTVVFE